MKEPRLNKMVVNEEIEMFRVGIRPDKSVNDEADDEHHRHLDVKMLISVLTNI